jgi:hypothetical protein
MADEAVDMATTTLALKNTNAPALPFATKEYSESSLNQFNNILRIYFNQIDNVLAQLASPPVYTVATLPGAAYSGIGARSFVTDALAPVFGSTVVAGGAVKTPVYCDGTNWKVG